MGSPLQGVVDAVGRQHRLDAVAAPLQQTVARAVGPDGFAGQQLKNFLHGTWLGHPLHPVLTDVPIGFWTAAFALDVIEAAGGDDVAAGADAAVALGLVGAAGTAVTGLADWQYTDGPACRLGPAHGLLNVSATLLYSTSLLLRRRGARGAARSVACAGFAVAAAGAYLGGSLVYDEGIGVNRAAGVAAPEGFMPVLAEGELREGEPRRVEAGGVPVLLVRSGGRIHALAGTCAHLGCSLAEGTVEEGSVVCPCHGSRYALDDGRVLRGPAAFPQPRFETRVQDGWVAVRAAAG